MARQSDAKANPVRAGKARRSQRGLGKPLAKISTKRPSQIAWPRTRGKMKASFESRSALGRTPARCSRSIDSRSWAISLALERKAKKATMRI